MLAPQVVVLPEYSDDPHVLIHPDAGCTIFRLTSHNPLSAICWLERHDANFRSGGLQMLLPLAPIPSAPPETTFSTPKYSDRRCYVSLIPVQTMIRYRGVWDGHATVAELQTRFPLGTQIKHD